MRAPAGRYAAAAGGARAGRSPVPQRDSSHHHGAGPAARVTTWRPAWETEAHTMCGEKTFTGGVREPERCLPMADFKKRKPPAACRLVFDRGVRRGLHSPRYSHAQRRCPVGVKWYANPSIPLDERSCRQLSEAWSRVSGDKTPGRVIAQCMFGFWRGLLDKGDHIGRAPRRVRCDYE